MLLRVINSTNHEWGLALEPTKHLFRPKCWHLFCYRHLSHAAAAVAAAAASPALHVIPHRKHVDSSSSCCFFVGRSHTGMCARLGKPRTSNSLCMYSSKGDGRNTSEDNHVPMGGDAARFESGKAPRELAREDDGNCDGHARLAQQEQKEWLDNEKISMDSRRKESPFLTRREKFKILFTQKVVPWENLHVSWQTFPYYINEHTKNILVECVASHLRQHNFASSFGTHLISSGRRILFQSLPGTELYRERVVKALAQDLHVPLLVLDSHFLSPYVFEEEHSGECEPDDVESCEECSSESEAEDDRDDVNEEDWINSADSKSDASDEDGAEVHATTQRVSDESDRSSKPSKSEPSEHPNFSNQPLKKGDRVKYIGPSIQLDADNRITLGKIPTSDGLKNAYTIIHSRSLFTGQRGEVFEVNGERVAIVFDIVCANETSVKNGQLKEHFPKAAIYWMDVKDIAHDSDIEAEDCYVAIEALCEVLNSQHPIIVYFPDFSRWLSGAVPKSKQQEFFRKVLQKFDDLPGPVVLICGQNKVETMSKEKGKLTMILPNFGRVTKLPLHLRRITEGLRGTKKSNSADIYKLFTNVFSISPPKKESLLRVFNKQLEEDKRIVISRSNYNELHKVLEENDIMCMDLLAINTDAVTLTKTKAEKVVGWAMNHYLSSCLLPSIKGEQLLLPRESIETAIMRLKEQENTSQKPLQNLKNLVKNEYESSFISSVVPPCEIDVKFDDIGALEGVKKTLNELVILPMRRPELFSQGNLLRPCKGILLFGPPGTGKTLLAKALATEARANFISITGSTLTSKWFGDAEKLTKALFSFASKLAPVIIFVDEVDSILGARGGGSEHEATRRMRNEFMAAWDGLRSKENQRILVLGATNRPFDLDDAVIRRLPRRIYVDLPNAENRMKILKVILAQENLQHAFQFDRLANATEGYSGSDLKNLCVAAAYRPVQEILEEEKKGQGTHDVSPCLRMLYLDDFIQSKEKVGPSVTYDAASMNELRKWNEQYGEEGSRKRSPFGF